MKWMAVLLLGVLFLSLNSGSTEKVTARSAATWDDLAQRGYSAVGKVEKESDGRLFLLRNPCATNSRPFYVRFKTPYIKKPVSRSCANGKKVDFYYVEQQ